MFNFTNEIAEECNVDFEFNEFKFPKYNLPSGVSEGEYIRKIVFKGLAKKYLKLEISGLEAIREDDIKEKLKENGFENVVERIEYELDIIDKMGYNGYFYHCLGFLLNILKKMGFMLGQEEVRRQEVWLRMHLISQKLILCSII